MPENTLELVPVAYIREEDWRDNLYGSNLPFTKGQTRMLPPDLAERFLRHADVFQLGEIPKAAKKGAKGDDTAALLELSDQAQAEAHKTAFDVQDLRDQVARMEKPMLAHFAMVNYRQTLDMRHNVDTLRQMANGFIDLYGVV